MPCFPKPQAVYKFKLGRDEKNDSMLGEETLKKPWVFLYILGENRLQILYHSKNVTNTTCILTIITVVVKIFNNHIQNSDLESHNLNQSLYKKVCCLESRSISTYQMCACISITYQDHRFQPQAQ